MRLALVLVISIVMVRTAIGAPDRQEPDTLKPPGSEVSAAGSPLDLPAVPSFELPAPEPGFFDPRYLRVRGKKLLDTEVVVKGYIIWIYDCIADAKLADEGRAQTQRRIDADPTLCERPKFYLGATRDTPADRALWVVDVPRPPNKLEKERLPKAELDAWPAVPKFKLGDRVLVTGTFATASPHSERNSDGLLVFTSMQPATSTVAATKAAASKPAATKATSAAPASMPAAQPATPMRTVVDPKVVNISMMSLSAGNKAAGKKQFTEAVESYRRAIASWDGNHLAWYGMGGSFAQQGEWKRARDAFATAAKLRPDAAMYQMWTGIASFEAAAAAAREAQAKRANLNPADIKADLSAVVFDDARAHLEQAIALDPALWRAHYYLGRIGRDGAREREAAEHFSAAIRSDRTKQAPYIALGELYRKWDYVDQAIAVVSIGAKELPATPEASDVFYVLGMAHDDRRAHKQAVAAFSRALELKPDNHKATFQRGQSYFRMGKRKEARLDLEAFVAAAETAPSLGFARAQAQRTLADLDAKK